MVSPTGEVFDINTGVGQGVQDRLSDLLWLNHAEGLN
jgi:hypothetical protein